MISAIWALIVGAGGVIIAVLAAYFAGKRGKTVDEAQSRADTFRRVQDADVGSGASDDDNREWLRNRAKR